MNRILITGPTGNVGKPLLRYLANPQTHPVKLLAGLRQQSLPAAGVPEGVEKIVFDFDDPATYLPALQQCNYLFLLRPGQVANTKIMQQVIDAAKSAGVAHIVFLSVQGADRMKWTPHHKTEALIAASGIPYTFLRPAYFMQNFEGPLLKDLKEKNRIFLPAGNTPFTIVDVEDVAHTAAKVLLQPQLQQNKAYDLTNEELLSFEDMAQIFSGALQRKIVYESPNLLHFYLQKKKEGFPAGFILIMMALHYLPRFSAVPSRSSVVQQITGIMPATLRQYIERNAALFV